MIATIGGLQWDVRDGTTDWNTINAAVGEDEYGLRDVDVYTKLAFDIGSHVGSIGIWLAHRGARVVVVEPVPANMECILRNAALNGVIVQPVQAALGSDFVLMLPEGDPHEFVANIGGSREDANARVVEVEAISFNDLVRMFGLPDIVKLDCEGGEWSALKDGSTLRSVPLIVGEYHPIPTADYSFPDLVDALPHHTVVQTGGNDRFGGFRATLDAS